jgi:hypothetical protein
MQSVRMYSILLDLQPMIVEVGHDSGELPIE